MDAHVLQTYQMQLEELQKDLLAQIAQHRGGVMSCVDSAIERFAKTQDSTASINTIRDLTLALGERELSELIDIDAALKRIQAGTFGACIDCSKPIQKERLDLVPQALRCPICQKRAEHINPFTLPVENHRTHMAA